MRDYLSEFLTGEPENTGALESGNRQNRQKPDGISGDACKPEPTKPTNGAFDAFVGNPSQARASFPTAATDRGRIGSAARPMVVRGTQMPSLDCLWATCSGTMTIYGHNRYLCGSCATHFELLQPEDLGVYVGDLADEPNAETEWVM